VRVLRHTVHLEGRVQASPVENALRQGWRYPGSVDYRQIGRRGGEPGHFRWPESQLLVAADLAAQQVAANTAASERQPVAVSGLAPRGEPALQISQVYGAGKAVVQQVRIVRAP